MCSESFGVEWEIMGIGAEQSHVGGHGAQAEFTHIRPMTENPSRLRIELIAPDRLKLCQGQDAHASNNQDDGDRMQEGNRLVVEGGTGNSCHDDPERDEWIGS